MNTYRQEWLNACFSNEKPEKITAIFNSGREIVYTSRILESLKTDKAVKMIVSNETGEILFER